MEKMKYTTMWLECKKLLQERGLTDPEKKMTDQGIIGSHSYIYELSKNAQSAAIYSTRLNALYKELRLSVVRKPGSTEPGEDPPQRTRSRGQKERD